ncbi:MAG TPA: hypothetical protein EYO33_21045 [Phycisphaerales bacterium]|nr:hypothetical protein [Phycisphaerales bacterium]
MWQWVVKEAAIAQAGGRLELSGGVPLGPEEFSMGYHRANEEQWAEFIEYAIQLGILHRDDGVLVISIWDQYFFLDSSRTKSADAYRKRAERAEKKLEKLSKAKESTSGQAKGRPNDVQQCPDTSQMSQIRSDHIRSDLIRSEDKRSDNSARDVSVPDHQEPVASWSADLFSKKSLSPDDLIRELKPDYEAFAHACHLTPKTLTRKLQVELLRLLGSAGWIDYVADPLVQLIALKMGINLACDVAVAGFTNPESAWPIALQDAGRCLEGASLLVEHNRGCAESGKALCGPHEAFRFLPTVLEKQLAGVGDSS